MKKLLTTIFFIITGIFYGQNKSVNATPRKLAETKKSVVKTHVHSGKINDSVAALIPQKLNDKFGFINQRGKVMIKHQYSNVGFFTEDCNLLNSPNEKVKKFGTAQYATVRLNDVDYRIDRTGKRVYQFKESDLGICPQSYKAQLYHAYILNGQYGIIEDSKFENPGDYRQYTIYPQYDYLHILEGDDLRNPMIIASKQNKFGIIDIHNKIIIPFEYRNIKRNFSWKLARLFEVSNDEKNYYYIDLNRHRY